ncbi:uncharacterized protein [Ptychodera flava]|uniref:uncharacterized protein n=1 Tax=Ptychodera flava TaxID=63121 RepID=UPI003969F7A4
MKSDHIELLMKINGAVANYSPYAEKAVVLRKMLKGKAKKISDGVKETLMNFISQHEDFKLVNPGEEAPERPGQISSEGHSHEQCITPTPGHSIDEPATKKRKLQSDKCTRGEEQSRSHPNPTNDTESEGQSGLNLPVERSEESNINPSPTSPSDSEAQRPGFGGGQMSPEDDKNGSNSQSEQEGTAGKKRNVKNGDGPQKDNQGTGSSTNNGSNGNGNHSNPDDTNQNTQGHINVRLRVSSGVPENNRPMADIEDALFRHASTDANAQQYMNGVTSIHPDLSGEGVERGSLNFIMRCGSSDAADALWNAYSSGRLDRMADKTFLSIPILDDIGARMLSLETLVDYQEYLQCKEEITRRDINSPVSSEGAKSPEDLCDVELVSIMNMEAETQTKEQNISVHRKQIEVKTVTKDKMQSTVSRDSQTFSESEKACMDEWVTLKRRMQQSDKLVLQEDGEKLKQRTKMLTYDVLSMKYITKGKVEELEKMRLSHDRIMKGIVPKDTVRRLSRQGNGPGEVWSP